MVIKVQRMKDVLVLHMELKIIKIKIKLIFSTISLTVITRKKFSWQFDNMDYFHILDKCTEANSSDLFYHFVNSIQKVIILKFKMKLCCLYGSVYKIKLQKCHSLSGIILRQFFWWNSTLRDETLNDFVFFSKSTFICL